MQYGQTEKAVFTPSSGKDSGFLFVNQDRRSRKSIARVSIPQRDRMGYTVTDCASAGCLQEPICDPARFEWKEVTKVPHYYLSVDALTQPMRTWGYAAPYGGSGEKKNHLIEEI